MSGRVKPGAGTAAVDPAAVAKAEAARLATEDAAKAEAARIAAEDAAEAEAVRLAAEDAAKAAVARLAAGDAAKAAEPERQPFEVLSDLDFDNVVYTPGSGVVWLTRAQFDHLKSTETVAGDWAAA